MCSSKKNPRSSTRIAIVPMSLNVGLAGAKAVIAAMFTGDMV